MEFLKRLKEVFVKSVPDTSEPGKVDKTDLAKVTRTAVLVGVASGITYALQNIDPNLFGSYGPLFTLAGAAILELLGKIPKGK